MLRYRGLRAAVFLTVFAFLASCTQNKPIPTNEATNTPNGEPTSTAVAQRKNVDLKIEGRILFVKNGQVWLWENNNQRRITEGGREWQPQWSPDGSSIAYITEADAHSDIWVLSLTSGKANQLTNTKPLGRAEGYYVHRPAWSPDGAKLAFVSNQTSFDMNLWQMSAEGRNLVQLTAFDSYTGGVDWPTWAPDGKQVAFTSFRSGVSQIWSFTIASGKWQQLTDGEDGAYDPCWSPDGKYIAYTGRMKKQNDIWVMAADGTGKTQLTVDGTVRSATWSPDSQYVAYIGKKAGVFDIWALKVEKSSTSRLVTSEPKQLTKGLQIDPASGLSWAK